MSQSVRLRNTTGAEIGATLQDISPDGLQAICPHRDMTRLLPAAHDAPARQSFKLGAVFELPYAGAITQVRATCRIIHINRLDEDDIELGLRFVQFSDASRGVVAQYIMNAMVHA
jgi:hypothetical protein